MRRIVWPKLDEGGRLQALERPSSRSSAATLESVRQIVEAVRSKGWPAVEHFSSWIDGEIPSLIEIGPIAKEARQALPRKFVEALELAARNVRTFHAQTRPRDVSVETMPGFKVSKLWRPVEHAGIYVPGGSAPLFSTLLMLALPARAAGVERLTVVTPPSAKGLHPAIALAAELCRIDAIWTVGGAQAIAALAFGAGEIGRVDLISGPGNSWVSAAKALVSSMPGGPRIDLPAGPSELMVIADESADPELVAADLLSQAEHDRAAQVLLVTPFERLAQEVEDEVSARLPLLPRAEIAREAMENARLIVVEDLSQAVQIANRYAPEHLSLAIAEPEALIGSIRNAGAVFAGGHAAETFGDYLGGSSHVLPTDGAARAWGGVTTQTFMKAMTVQSVTKEAAGSLAKAAACLARLEGLEAHARAADLRLGEAA